jgi:hypothetical protein
MKGGHTGHGVGLLCAESLMELGPHSGHVGSFSALTGLPGQGLSEVLCFLANGIPSRKARVTENSHSITTTPSFGS